ncbi:MAG: glycosyltransferase family 2 protein [Candidatus Bipolaricaulota bacterium]|nr:glycosyltransferase family 2 protein [Candidatus Bipolaricaulota bacterium]MDW8126200.1 glycosyltransferase [Candidatus Bipolaricaulota bacterium]
MSPTLWGIVVGILVGAALALLGEAKNRWTLKRLAARAGSPPTLSIVIASRNEEAVIENTLRTLAAHAPLRTEIVVVDGSTDSTPQILARLCQEIPALKVLRDPYRTGKPAALNYALKHVTGEVILFLDADARMDHAGLTFYPQLLAQPAVRAVYADFAPYNLRKTWVIRAQEYFFSFARRFVFSGLFWRPVFMTCGLFVRKDLLQEVGEFDPKTLVDDFDLGIRLARAKVKVPFVRGPRCLIQYAPTLRDLFYQFLRWYTGGIREMVEEIKNGDLSYLLLMAGLALVIYFPQIALLVDGIRGTWLLVPLVLPGFLAFLWAAASVPSLLDQGKPGLVLLWAFPFLYFWMQLTVAVAFFRSFRGPQPWYKVRRERG